MTQAVEAISLFTSFDVELFRAGKHYKLYEKFGSRTVPMGENSGVYFAVWAPNAKKVSVVGNFNGWNPYAHELFARWDESGIWEGAIPQLQIGEVYKYAIHLEDGTLLEKADPFGIMSEVASATASIVCTTWYEWQDHQWMENRHAKNSLNSPCSVYEMHLGSWSRDPENPERLLSYGQIADALIPYLTEMAFTHVEFLPVMEHPYYPSWGYQITGYFSATSRYGSPQELMYLIDQLHQAGIGVILDWVPSHFPGDQHGLFRFDGTALYEHEDPRKGYHPDWKSYIFNYGRNEVRSFLISNAYFWLDLYHVDGLRVDAVASMLYLDYSREHGEWIPNVYGGNENLEAVSFLKEMNTAIYREFPDVQTIAEESTSWGGVSRPTFQNGLGFGMKWMMGWMHDTLNYFQQDPINRKYHHHQLTFGTIYAFHENFMLPLSHDEVVHGKKSLINKMPGDEWQKFANLRALYLFMYTFVGTKLLFMGGEFGQTSEWNPDKSLDWHLLQYPPHDGLKNFVAKLNRVYRDAPALYELAFLHEGFEWIDMNDKDNSVFVYLRKGYHPDDDLLIVLNLTPVVRHQFRVGVPRKGVWSVLLNSDDTEFFGSGQPVYDAKTENTDWMHRKYAINIDLPPLSGLILKKK